MVQGYTQGGGVRPCGVSLLVAGFDDVNGTSLYQIDPTGTFYGWKAAAIGRRSTESHSYLEKRYKDRMSLEDGVHTMILTMREGFMGQMCSDNVELAVVTKDGFKLYDEKELENALKEVTE